MEIDKKAQKFYNQNPFPDYTLDRFDDKEELALSAGQFSRILDRSIPQEASIIDVGTGTGQMSAFLSLRRKCVWGVDFSNSSIHKAGLLKEKLKLDSWNIKKLDIMNLKEIDAFPLKFDYLLCLGVLHHTSNPYLGFKNILKLLKPGGYVAIGLYNKFGRIPHKIRVFLAKTIFKNNSRVKESFIKMQIEDIRDKAKVEDWWHDQFLHPHETSHSLGQVLSWFKKNDIEYYQSLPSAKLFDQSDLGISGVWNNYKENYPYLPVRVWKQLLWVFSIQREGGCWITFGRKKK